MHQKNAKMFNISFITLFFIVHILMGQSKKLTFSDSYHISNILPAQNDNIMDPLSVIKHKDQFLMSPYSALLWFSQIVSEHSDATVTKYGRNYETNGRLYAFDAQRQGQFFHNYTALNLNNYFYHFFLLILLSFFYNCGFLSLNFSYL